MMAKSYFPTFYSEMQNNRTETNPATTLRLQSGANYRGVVYPTR